MTQKITQQGDSFSSGESSALVLLKSEQAPRAPQLSDKKLLALCSEYGKKALLWRAKFVGLLPEVARRRAYKKAGCESIFEFAKKTAGLSEEHVRRVLSLEQRFFDKPVLKKMLITGEVSMNKLARVASVVTNENEKFWSKQVKILPNRSLETLVRDEKMAAKSEKEFVHVHKTKNVSSPSHELELRQTIEKLHLSEEIAQRLKKLKELGHDINKILGELLDERELKIAIEKEKLAIECDGRAATRNVGVARSVGEIAFSSSEDGAEKWFNGSKVRVSRHIPIKIRRIMEAEFGMKCAVPQCQKKSAVMHHTGRFALTRSHNPYFLAPLCKEHHDIAHAVDGRFFEGKG